MIELISTHQDDILIVHAVKLTPGCCLSPLIMLPPGTCATSAWDITVFLAHDRFLGDTLFAADTPTRRRRADLGSFRAPLDPLFLGAAGPEGAA